MTADEARKRVAELERWRDRVFRRIGWRWDAPRLAVVHPDDYETYRRACAESRAFRGVR